MAKLTKDYNLEVLYPDIAKEWHPTKNGDLKPYQLTPYSNKKVWWLCYENHSFKKTVNKRTRRNQSCGYCSNRILGYGNDLASIYPSIAKEWHPTKNGDLLPSQIIAGSGQKFWWQCNFGHEWSTTINNRVTKNSNCPKCSNRVSRPALFIFSELKTIFNKIDFEKKVKDYLVDIYIKDINLIIEYDGYYYHKKRLKSDKIKKIKMIEDGFSLVNIRVAPLDKIFNKDLVIKRNHSRSFVLIEGILNKILDQKILNNKKTINKINKYLEGGKIQNEKYFYDLLSALPGALEGKSLYDKMPHLKSEWHPTKNGRMTIYDFNYGSNIKVWWICSKGHEWKAPINRRNSGSNCPFCSGHKTAKEKSIGIKFPKLAEEWHPTRNGVLTPFDVLPNSDKIVWWLCANGHEYKLTVKNQKKRKFGCLSCLNKNYKKKFYALKNNKKIGEWTSQAQCARDLDLKSTGNISACLNGKKKSYIGYTFKYIK